MKKNIIALTIAAMALSLVACTTAPSSVPKASSGGAPPTSPPAGSDITIAFSMNAMDEYQSEWYGYIEEYAKELGVKVVMSNAEGKIDKQLADVESAIVTKPNAIVIRASDTAGVVPAFEAAEKANIPTLDSGFGSDYKDTLKVLSSQVTLCNLQADYCIDWLKNNEGKTLKVGYIWGVQGVSSTQDRYDGWKNKLFETYPDRVEILAEKVCNWSAVDTMAAVEDWIQAFPEMNCIVAMSDEMALAATNVLQAAGIGLDKCIVVGIDGSPAAQKALTDGTLSASVYTSKRADARLTLDCAVKIAKGEDMRGQTIDPGDDISALITKDNLAEVLAKIG